MENRSGCAYPDNDLRKCSDLKTISDGKLVPTKIVSSYNAVSHD